MKNLFNTLLLTVLIFGCQSKPTGPKLYIAPNPGDLSAIEGLQESTLFDMTVNGQDVFVYHGHELEYNKYGFAKTGGHFVNFGFEPGELTLTIKTTEMLNSYNIKPAVDNKQIDANTIEVKLNKPQKFLFTADLETSGENWFIVSAEEPETNIPSKDDPTVLYLEAGVHQFERGWDPYQNGIKTLYLEHGAVVQATIHTVGHDSLSLIGRGVFAQAIYDHAKKTGPNKAEWMGDMMGIYFRECNNLTLDGYTVVNCPSYQSEVADCENVYVNNIKLLGFGEGNNDGIHLYGRNIEVENSFLAGSDDRICVTGLFDREKFEVKTKEDLQPRLEDTDVHNLRIRNIVFWGQKNGADLMLTWNGGKTCKDIIVENVHSLGFTNKGFVACKHGGSVILEEMVFRNVHLYHNRIIDLEVKEASCWGQGGGAVRNLLFENVTIDADAKDVSNKMIGHSASSNIDSIIFRNVTANGKKITSLAETNIETNEFVSNIIFE